MNSEELVREILKDYLVLRKAQYALLKLRRPALKSKTKHVQVFYDYKTKNNNNWVILCDYFVKNPTLSVIAYYVDQLGLQAYMIDANRPTLTHYSAHFLERFNERFLHESNLSKIEILKKYLSKNNAACIKWLPNFEKYKPFFGRSRDGIILGNVEDVNLHKIIHVKTFIANDMIFENQKEVFDCTGEKYKQYWDEVL